MEYFLKERYTDSNEKQDIRNSFKCRWWCYLLPPFMLPADFLNLHRGNIFSQLVTAGGEITLVEILINGSKRLALMLFNFYIIGKADSNNYSKLNFLNVSSFLFHGLLSN